MALLKRAWILLLIFLFVINTTKAVVMNETQMSYLKHFGYMDKETKMGDTSSMVTALEHFQEFMGLEETGELDAATMEMMSKPRCGMKDMEPGSRRRKKRYALQGSNWSRNLVTWALVSYPRTLPQKNIISKTLRKAFQVWSGVTPLKFRSAPKDEADIIIEFFDRRTDEKFDGPGMTLAFAYYPEFGGDIHFDDEENWTTKSGRELRPDQINLLLVAIHEIGHSLGLKHSDIHGTMMFPTYDGRHSIQNPLKPDDIQGIQRLYGKSRSKTRFRRGRSLKNVNNK